MPGTFYLKQTSPPYIFCCHSQPISEFTVVVGPNQHTHTHDVVTLVWGSLKLAQWTWKLMIVLMNILIAGNSWGLRYQTTCVSHSPREWEGWHSSEKYGSRCLSKVCMCECVNELMHVLLYYTYPSHLCPIAYLKFLIPIQFILHNC